MVLGHRGKLRKVDRDPYIYNLRYEEEAQLGSVHKGCQTQATQYLRGFFWEKNYRRQLCQRLYNETVAEHGLLSAKNTPGYKRIKKARRKHSKLRFAPLIEEVAFDKKKSADWVGITNPKLVPLDDGDDLDRNGDESYATVTVADAGIATVEN